MADPAVSVVMPTYNQADFLMESVDSVLAQTWTDLELIIVNDGSTDATPDLLAAIEDPRVQVVHQKNGGASAAMNVGFSKAKGEWLTWLASDNLFKPTFLEKGVEQLRANPEVGLVYASFENVDADGNHIDYQFLEPYYAGLVEVNPGAVGVAFLYTRAVAEACGTYLDLVCNDLDYWLKAARICDFSFLPEVLGVNRKHGNMQTVVHRGRLAAEVGARLAEERGAERTKPTPDLTGRLFGVRRAVDQLARAVVLRLDAAGGTNVVVVGDEPERSLVVAALGARGIAAEGTTVDAWTSAPGACLLPLDTEVEDALRKAGTNPDVILGFGGEYGRDF